MNSGSATAAAAAGSWQLDDLLVNRMGFGAMRLPQHGRADGTSTSGARPTSLRVPERRRTGSLIAARIRSSRARGLGETRLSGMRAE